MKSHLSEDTDDENCEDPIRLFDSNINAVYFGSQLHTHDKRRDIESRRTLEQFTKKEFCQPIQNSTVGGPDNELIQTTQSSPISECAISSLSVKLVDCGKFPWYFRKYTQQIMQKINTTEHSDSENEIDVESVVDDSDDCVIVEVPDITTKIFKYEKNCQPPVKSRRNDTDLQRALSIKNMVKVDFKRNQGLVGMKVTPKLQTLTTLDLIIDRKQMVEVADANQKNVLFDEKVISATDRTLSHIIGTQRIPLKDERASNTTQFKSNNNKDFGEKPIIVKSSCQNVTVQFESKKMSEKLIDNLKTNKTSVQSSEGKMVNKMPNTSLLKIPENKLNIFNEKKIDSKITIKEKNTNVSKKDQSHGEGVKITCQNKNDQIKIRSNHNPWIGHLIKKNNKKVDIKEIKCTKRDFTESIANKLDEKPRKKTIIQKNEPKSPILHCSTVPKKPKHEIPHKCNEANTNSNPHIEPIKLKKIVDRLYNLNSCNSMNEATNRTPVPKHVISKYPGTKPLDVTNKQALQKESSIIQDKTTSIVDNIHAKSSIVPERLPKKYNEGKTDFRTNNFQNALIIPSSQNNTYEQNLLREIHQNVNEQKLNSFPITNSTLKAPNKNNNEPLSNSNVLTSTVITPTSGSNSVSSVNTNFSNNYETHYPNHNTLPNKMNNNNVSNKNINPSNQNTSLPNNYGSHYRVHNELPNKMSDNNVSYNINPSDQNTNLSNYYGSHYPIHNALPNKMSGNNISNNNINLSDQNTSCPNYYGSHYAIHNALPNKMCDNNISNNNINVQVQNPYASAIISNNRTNFPYEKFHEPPKQPMAPHSQRPINILHSQPQSRDSRPPFTIFYPPAPSQSLPSNFPSPANHFPNQFHPPHAHLAQQPSYKMQNLYRKCWLPQNMTSPPPPLPSASPTNNSPRNDHDVAKSKNSSYLNRPSASVMQSLQKHQNSINTLQTKNNSIIGINTNGFVKKINIVAMSARTNVDTKNGTVEVEQKTNPQTMCPLEDNSKVVATKTEMLKELDKLSFVDENISNFKGIYAGKIIGEDKKENTLEVAIMTKKPGRFETLKLTVNNKDNPPIQQTKSAKGYSPPILPIPTYQKVLDKVIPNLKAATPNIALRTGDPRSMIRNESKPMRKRDFVKCGKRKLNNTCQDNKKKEDAKKISLDEYKQRKLQNDSKPQSNKRICNEKYNYNGNRPNVECKFKKNVDCCNTETDLGYDSDSTVVL